MGVVWYVVWGGWVCVGCNIWCCRFHTNRFSGFVNDVLAGLCVVLLVAARKVGRFWGSVSCLPA